MRILATRQPVASCSAARSRSAALSSDRSLNTKSQSVRGPFMRTSRNSGTSRLTAALAWTSYGGSELSSDDKGRSFKGGASLPSAPGLIPPLASAKLTWPRGQTVVCTASPTAAAVNTHVHSVAQDRLLRPS